MNEQVKVQTLVRQKYLDHKIKNPNFSIRAFARKLGMQPSATNEIMKGERRISRKVAEQIADRLMLDPSERNDLLKDFPLKLKRKSNKTREKDLEVLKLTSNQFALISDWIHFALLSLMRLKEFRSDIGWMAERFGVSETEIRKALMKLQHLNLIFIANDGAITRTPEQVRTTDDIRDLSLQTMHLNDMEIAKTKIKDISLDKRDFTNYTFPANPKTLKRAKEIIRKAQDDLEELMADEEAEEVYRVCMYLFPLTNLKPDKETI